MAGVWFRPVVALILADMRVTDFRDGLVLSTIRYQVRMPDALTHVPINTCGNRQQPDSGELFTIDLQLSVNISSAALNLVPTARG